MDAVVYACDVGSTRSGAFAWVRAETGRSEDRLTGGRAIDRLAEAIVSDLLEERSIALGLEAPLFIPVPEDSGQLSTGRSGEGARSFAAPAGLTVAALSLHQLAWLLRRVREAGPNHRLTLDADDWPPADNARVLFLWEAFVSEAAHSNDHLEDAATACHAFLSYMNGTEPPASISAEAPLSLAGAAALWSGWRSDTGVLREPTLVVKPNRPAPASVKVDPEK